MFEYIYRDLPCVKEKGHQAMHCALSNKESKGDNKQPKWTTSTRKGNGSMVKTTVANRAIRRQTVWSYWIMQPRDHQVTKAVLRRRMYSWTQAEVLVSNLSCVPSTLFS